MILFTFLFCYFDACIEHLGHPQFLVREQAQAILSKAWPLPLLSVCRGAVHEDPEIRFRCRRIYDADRLADWYATLLVLRESKYRELPWGDFEYTCEIVKRCPTIGGGLKRFAVTHGLCQSWETFDFEVCGRFDYPAGLDHIRFRWRRIPSSTWASWDANTVQKMRSEWQAMTMFKGK